MMREKDLLNKEMEVKRRMMSEKNDLNKRDGICREESRQKLNLPKNGKNNHERE